jgi:PiT family inorganic phosphate transporter
MPRFDVMLVLIVALTLAYDFTNGFNDLPAAIATVVSTRIMGFPVAVLMAGTLMFVGAYTSTAVARTVAGRLVRTEAITNEVIVSAILGALVWDVITWWLALPSSSSHALIGGLCGASIVRGGLGTVDWGRLSSDVVIPMILSPLVGLGIAFLVMTAILTLFAHAGRRVWDPAFRYSQIFSAGSVAFAHGSGSGQKGMGILTLALLSRGTVHTPDVPLWAMAACTAAIVAGGASGSMRIIATLGNKIVRLNPVQGFAAQACCASVVYLASHLGMPVSTTQVLSGTVMGVGAAQRSGAVRWGVVQKMLGAWIVTLPAAGLVAAGAHQFLQRMGYH